MAYISDRTGAEVDQTLDDADAHHANTSNPHSVTKTQLSLGNVDNTSDANKPVSTATQAAIDALGDSEFQAINFRIPSTVLDEQSGAIEIDMASNGFRRLTLTDDAVFSTLNRADGRAVSIRIFNDSSNPVALSFPAWTFVPTTPTELDVGKYAILTLTAFGVDDEDIMATFVAQS